MQHATSSTSQLLLSSICSCTGRRAASSSSAILRRAASSSSRSNSTRKKGASSAAPAPNLFPFSEAVHVLHSLAASRTNAASFAAYELTLIPRLAGSVNINSLRGRTFLAHDASNKKKKEVIVVFAEGEKAEEARKEGGEEIIVGGKELVDEILQSVIQPTKIIATPDFLPIIARSTLPRILGPKGLMPSTKRGTVTSEIARAIREARGGLDWLGTEMTNAKLTKDKNAPSRGLISVPIARMGWPAENVEQNVRQFVAEVLDVCNGKGTQAEVSTTGQTGGGGKKKMAEIEKMYLTTSQGMSVQIQDVQRLVQTA